MTHFNITQLKLKHSVTVNLQFQIIILKDQKCHKQLEEVNL